MQLDYSSIVFIVILDAVAHSHSATLVSYTDYYSLEMDNRNISIGDIIVLYISYRDVIFSTPDHTFQITVYQTSQYRIDICYTSEVHRDSSYRGLYKNAFVVGVPIDVSGEIHISVEPLEPNKTIDTTFYLRIIIHVQPAVKSDVACYSVGKSTINNRDNPVYNSALPQMVDLKMTDFVLVSRSKNTCNSLQDLIFHWTMSIIHNRVTSACINPTKIVPVNFTDYTSQILHVPLPVPEKDATFVIQPYTIPPGNYILCNAVVNNDVNFSHCKVLRIEGGASDCSAFADVVRINIIPEMEEFTWPIKDLIIRVTRVYSIFGIYSEEENEYSYSWRCTGDVLCQSLQAKKRVFNNSNDNIIDLELTGQGNEILIPADYMTAGTTITLKYIVNYNHLMTNDPFSCTGSVERKITFVPSLSSDFYIRCYLNCRYDVNPEAPLVVGLNCTICGITPLNDPKIHWSIPELPLAQISNDNATMLVVEEYGLKNSNTFYINVNVSYTLDGQTEEIYLGKIFRFPKSLKGTVLKVTDYLIEKNEATHADPDAYAAMFPRYDIAEKFYMQTKQFLGIPVIVSISLVPDAGYVLIRTLWGAYDVCVESFQTEDMFAAIQINVSTVYGANQIGREQTLFNISRRVPALSPDIDLESLFMFAKYHPYFFANDETYLSVISRAIEITARDINPEDKAVVLQEKLSTNGTKSRVVEMVLNSMLSDDENGLTYSNINLYLVCLIRMLSIRVYTVSILDKAIQLLKRVQALHETVLEDPVSDYDLNRLKLDALYSITVYLLKSWKDILTYSQWKNVLSDIHQETDTILVNIAERQRLMYPNSTYIANKRYAVNAFWVDPFQINDDLNIELDDSRLTINIAGLRSTEWFNFAFFTNINGAVHASRESAILVESLEDTPNAPVVHVIMKAKRPSLQPFLVDSPGVYNIIYAVDVRSLHSSNLTQVFGVYRTKDRRNMIEDSDCYFFRIEATTKYATIINVEPTANVSISFRIVMTNKLSKGITVVDANEIILPRTDDDYMECKGVPKNPYSIFLPAITLRQKANVLGDISYYVAVKIAKNQFFRENYVNSSLSGLIEIGQVAVNFTCIQAGCLQIKEGKLTSKDCQANRCIGAPLVISCRCDRGNIFTASVKGCNIRWFDNKRLDLRIKGFDAQNVNLSIPAFLLSMYLIFGAWIRRARKRDLLERPMGKTFALTGVYSPIIHDQYLMCLVTGFGGQCGTTSIPYITIIGNNNVSPRYKLETKDYVFMDGSEIWLLFSVPVNVGRPKQIVLSLEPEDTEISPWFVKELYMRHISSGNEWSCSVNTWIPNPSICGLPFTLKDVVGNAGTTFASILLRLLRIQHPVFGSIYNIPGSDFTKAQHVVLSFCGLLILMMICMQVQHLPTPELIGEFVTMQQFSLSSDLFIRAVTCALATMVPTYFLGKLLDIAKPLNPLNVEWRKTIIDHRRKSESLLSIVRENEDSVITTTSDKMQMSLAPEENNFRASFNVYESTSFTATAIRKVISGQNYKEPESQASKLRKHGSRVDNVVASKISKTLQSKTELDFESDIRINMPTGFWLPTPFILLLMIVITACITYYIFGIGVFFNTTDSLKYLYTVCVAFVILMVVLYPLLLVVMAVLNTIMYVSGKPYYGVQRESEFRVQTIFNCKRNFYEIANSGIVESRMKSLGDLESQMLSGTSISRSHAWCNELTQKEAFLKKKQVRYNNLETVVFLVLAILIINVVAGSVWNSFLQTQFISTSLGVGRVNVDADKVLTTDTFWDHLESMFSTINMWRSNDSINPLTILSAVRVRQLRTNTYTEYCIDYYPGLLEPKCQFDIEDTEIETGAFANSWFLPIPPELAEQGPYTYAIGEYVNEVVTPNHHYPDGGYSIMMTESMSSIEKLNFLRKNKWVDGRTKAVVVNMNLLNADSGLLTIVEHVYEFRLAGIFMYTTYINTMPLIQRDEVILSWLILLFALITLYFLIFEIKACFTEGLIRYFSLAHSWFLLTERCLCIGVLVVYFWLKTDKTNKLEQVREVYISEMEDSVMVDFETVSEITLYLILVSSLLVITCLMKVLLRFRDNVLMAIFVNMIPSVMKLTLLPVLGAATFALLGTMLFRSVVKYFYNMYDASITVTILMLETSALVPIVEAAGDIGKLYITALYSVMFFIILNYFIVLVNETFSDYKRQVRMLGK